MALVGRNLTALSACFPLFISLCFRLSFSPFGLSATCQYFSSTGGLVRGIVSFCFASRHSTALRYDFLNPFAGQFTLVKPNSVHRPRISVTICYRSRLHTREVEDAKTCCLYSSSLPYVCQKQPESSLSPKLGGLLDPIWRLLTNYLTPRRSTLQLHQVALKGG